MQRIKASLIASRYFLILSFASALGGTIGSYLRLGFLEIETVLEFGLVASVFSCIFVILHLILVKKP